MEYPISDFDHVFAIPAYGQPVHLSECIESILAQRTKLSRIVLGTSTPNAFINRIAAKYGLMVFENPVRSDIAGDWNFAMGLAHSRYVTVAHQDDIYNSEYLNVMGELAVAHPEMSIAFSDYQEHTNSEVRRPNLNLRIKRRLCARAFGSRSSIGLEKEKRRLLNLGNPVCCPSVMFNRKVVPEFCFDPLWKTNLDWDAWLRLAEQNGAFVYANRKLVSKRVHAASETTVTIANRIRQTEDYKMFTRLWPRPVAALIAAVYSAGYWSNRVS